MQRCLNTILGYAASLRHSFHALQVLLLPLSPRFPYDLLNMLLEKKISNLSLVSSHREEVVSDKRKKRVYYMVICSKLPPIHFLFVPSERK